MNKQNTFQLVNPFSEKFLETWELYKAYRKETHHFKFVGVISEQMSLKKLVEVAGGDETRAVRIVEQTIASGKWMGFYPLKTTTYKENGKSRVGTDKADYEDASSSELVRRLNEAKSNGNSSHLKAI